MSQTIHHEGVVESLEGTVVRVRIMQASACSACHAHGVCMAADSKEKIVEALCEDHTLQAGDKVDVVIAERTGWKAILLAYILPFVVLMGVLGGMNLSGESEAIAGVVAICAVGMYYIVLHFFRHRLQREFSFQIRKI